jgi:glycosyltransferase involved in cell wall biosynthesis
MLRRPDVLILIDHYLPGYKSGGPMRTTANTVEWLGDAIQFRILTRDRDYRETTPYPELQTGVWHRVGKALVRYLAPEELTLFSLLRILRATPHDLIYLNSTFSTRTVVVLLFARLGLLHRPIVLASRGSLSDGALGLKPVKKRIYLTAARLLGLYDRVHWHSTSDEETRDIQSVFGGRRQPRIVQIPNLPMPITDEVSRTRTKEPGSLRIVMLSRIARMKNLELMAAALDGVRGAVQLDFWGPIEDPAYWEDNLKRFHRLSPNVQVHHCGSVAPDQVSAILSEYDLFFMPSLSENFGHAILEALCAGCPVLISDRTPWNAVNERGAGWAVALDRPDQFRQIIQHLIDADHAAWQAYSQRARQFALDYLASSRAVDETRRFLIETAAQATSS